MAGYFQNKYPNPCRFSPNNYFGSKFVTVCVTGKSCIILLIKLLCFDVYMYIHTKKKKIYIYIHKKSELLNSTY